MEITKLQYLFKEKTSGIIDWGESFNSFRLWLLPVELRFGLIIVLFILLVLVNVFIFYSRNTRRQPIIFNDSSVYKIPLINKTIKLKKLNHPIWVNKLKIINISVGLYLIFITIFSFGMKPQVVITTPNIDSYMRSCDEVIELVFDLPIDQETVRFNLSPEVKGVWEVEPINDLLPFRRIAKFYPEQSIPPDSEVVIYVVGIRQWYGLGKQHEQSIEFKSPRTPTSVDSSISTNAQNVQTNENIQLKYDVPLGDHIKIDVVVQPEAEFEIEEQSSGTQQIVFKNPLKQDQEYNVKVLSTPRSYDVKTGEDMELGETAVLNEFNFKTVAAPFVESYSPNGSAVRADSEVKIVFDQPMDRESVEQHLVISPETPGELVWDDNKTLRFLPENGLVKDTAYEIKLAIGVASSLSGVIEQDVVMSFQTLGKVKVLSTSPVTGTNGHDPSTTNIAIQFDQEVDKVSAQQSFSISPPVVGTFSWDGNKMIFSTAGKLNFATKYTYSLKPGIKSVYGVDSTDQFVYNFTTKADIFSLDVPWYKQQEGFTCNIAATRMVLAYRGVYVSESDVKNAVGIGTDPNKNWVPGYGVHWGPIASYIGKYRQVSIKSGWNIAELAAEIENGNPVILWWYNRNGSSGVFEVAPGVNGYHGMHSEVARGFIGSSSAPSSIMTNDPWRGRLTYKSSVFLSTWSYIGYKAIVVY